MQESQVKKIVSNESQPTVAVPVTITTSSTCNTNAQDTKPLVACYGQDSDQELDTTLLARTRSGEVSSSPPATVAKRVKVKLSARGRELISTSLTTAKARATDFIETSEGLKPIASISEEASGITSPARLALLENNGTKKRLTSELANQHPAESLERPFSQGDLVSSSREDSITSEAPVNKKAKFESMIHFVKAETLLLSEKNREKVTTPTDEESELSEESMKTYIKDNSSLLKDKMKFLSAGKETVSPVQIWAIQLETLLTAWESKYLKASFLKSWLDSTSKELRRLESSVAPPGWLCTWSRYDTHYHIHLVIKLVSVLFCLFRITLKSTVSYN
uniref:Uncharacterized protein n=1 Tax=Rhodnius prolixus TaxID=13249 RepID=T1I9U8_RHOPR